ncbi:hypothetical protein FisN_35Lh039 [Fistulifera solaris]|uniref:Uncharacterized protein n=1 Tax=Fistulifera solaris TaxID=1519565 RepID=A0A1Z5KPE1_FISSO|nr:hypothetical protein FisN_35Lh039 [Fistulifera solaris]|eukprot:GAX28183.1 hypothetical protein FisN_35Lh039 [Fistulifera solaris]
MEHLDLDGIEDGLPATAIDKECVDNIFDSDRSVVSLSPMGSPLPIDEPRRVSFAPIVQVYPSQLKDVDESCWYSRDELMQFREAARRMASYFWSFTSTRQENRPMLALGEETRGLEGKFCYERQRRKFWSKRYIVGASKRKWPAKQIADAALQLDKWASDLALEEGKRDYERAYQIEEENFNSSDDKKRCFHEVEHNERSVKQRLR